MNRIKMILASLIAVLAIGAVSASAASADGTVYGTIAGDAAGQEVTPCDFAIDYTGGPPPTTISLIGSTFRGAPDVPCDPETLTMGDVDVSFSGSGPYVATLGAFEVTGEVEIFPPFSIECTFPVNAGLTLSSSTQTGPFAGGGESDESDCFGLTAELTVSDLTIDED